MNRLIFIGTRALSLLFLSSGLFLEVKYSSLSLRIRPQLLWVSSSCTIWLSHTCSCEINGKSGIPTSNLEQKLFSPHLILGLTSKAVQAISLPFKDHLTTLVSIIPPLLRLPHPLRPPKQVLQQTQVVELRQMLVELRQ